MAIEVQNMQLAAAPQSKRIMRKPVHPFSIKFYPYQIQPFLIAPVLPGETLINLLYQSKTHSALVKNGLMGWWYETYFFYVKHRDLSITADLQSMVLDPSFDISGQFSSFHTNSYHTANSTTPDGINFVNHCLNTVTEAYFRYEGETAGSSTINNGPCASWSVENWMDSLSLKSVVDDIDFDVDLDADTTITASEVEKSLRIYQSLMAAGLTNQSYDDFLRQYGVKIPDSEIDGKPELLRYVRKWKQPARLIDPADGSPVAQLQWDLTERADKNRLFKEPGFIFGVSVCRPKVYSSTQKGTLTSFMTDAYSWLPAMMLGDANTGLKTHAVGSGPISGATEEYAYDLRDLFQYGEQFINYDPDTAGNNNMALPLEDLSGKRYPSDADVNALFVAGGDRITTDGIVTLSIKSQVQDLSATVA